MRCTSYLKNFRMILLLANKEELDTKRDRFAASFSIRVTVINDDKIWQQQK